jgi:aminoglycoside phosphotransferase
LNHKDTRYTKENQLFSWLTSHLGPVELVFDQSRPHAGERASTHRLCTDSGYCYLKIYPQRADWETEVHAYEHWAPVFGESAPRLLAVRDKAPLALVISELEGRALEGMHLPANVEREVWRQAGKALRPLHELEEGEFFGACLRDGSPAGKPVYEARQFVTEGLEDLLERGRQIGCLKRDELAVVEQARGLVASFEGVRPVPCHRDYCPPNWLVSGESEWRGVIDFEFARWDVRCADFTRYPDWEWINRPDLVEAFFDGYGRALILKEEQQRLFSHVLYALGAVVWGMENVYFGYAEEGRVALSHLGELLA